MTNSAEPDQMAPKKLTDQLAPKTPTDLELHCLQRQGTSELNRTTVNDYNPYYRYSAYLIIGKV